jgi:hypothetical protein
MYEKYSGCFLPDSARERRDYKALEEIVQKLQKQLRGRTSLYTYTRGDSYEEG